VQRSTLAWFRAAPPDITHSCDDTAALIEALREPHDIDVITASEAHDFVWRNFRRRYDLCVYELSDSAGDEFVWSYLVHYPGVLVLRDLPFHVSRAILASRVTVVPHRTVAQTVEDLYPQARVRSAPAGVQEAPTVQQVHGTDDNDSDIVVALQWQSPWSTRALAGMAAGKAVVVFESEATAEWPALNPQTWQPRGLADGAPVVVSIDPRDEQHSLMLAIKRLSADKALRDDLGAAARAWWMSHATVAHAVTAWKPILQEAMTLPLPAVSAADGTERAREILDELGVSVDFL
jgi:hypothetical protein